MKILKWLGIAFGAFVVLLIAAILLIPVLFGDRIEAEVTKQIDRYVDADVAYGDINLTLLRDFPSLSLVAEDLAIDGRGAFDTVQLASIGEFAVSVDFWSAVGDGPIQIKGIELVAPKLHILTLADGRTNTDIVRNLEEAADTAATTGSTTSIQLDRYAIVDGEVIYDDRSSDLYLSIVDLDHEGSGDFTATQFDLSTETRIASLTAISGGITYARKAVVAYDADLFVDTDAGTLTLADNELSFNELKLAAEGVIGLPDERGAIKTDLRLVAPEQDFRALWSAVPAAFTQDLTGLKTSGSFALNGELEGTYVPEPESYPAFTFGLTVDNASVQYPDLPKAITQLNMRAEARSAGADLSDLILDVERFSFALGANPFSGSLRVKQSLVDPAFNLTAEGTLDLADLADALPLEDVNEFAGRIALDLTASGTASGAESDLRSITSDGLAEVTNVIYDAEGMPRIAVAKGLARFSGSEVTIEDMALQAGRSDMVINGKLTDPFALATETGTLGGSFKLRAGTLDANEWLEEPEPAVASTSTATTPPAVRPFDRFDIAFDAEAESVVYDVYTLTNVRSTGNVTSDQLRLDATSFDIEGSDISMEGTLDNLYGYSFDEGELTGTLRAKANTLDLLALSEVGVDPNATPDPNAPPAEYIPLPERMSIRVATAVGQMKYDNITLDDVTGVIVMADQNAVIENGRGKVLGGQLNIDGGYQYRGEDIAPTFDLKYDLQNISFQRAFEELNTVQKLAPIAKYITGNFNTNMVMSSELGRDMMPVLTALNADGFINTLNATIQEFGPLTSAADKLGLAQLKSIELKNTKNWFTIQDGTVAVRPFDVNWGGIDATIGGSHGLDQAMDYDIIALVPRALLGKNSVGAAANKGLDFLGGQASKLGLDLNVGEFVRVGINLTGSIDNPNVGIKLLGTEGEGGAGATAGAALKDLAAKARDSIEQVAKARLDAAKADAEQRARAVGDSVRSAAEQRARAAADEAKARATEEAKRLADKATAKAGEEAKKAAEEAAARAGKDAEDKAKDALKGIFGKKKPDK